ncbi:MAG: hypothetical protein LJE61_10095 [Thiocapsa sp.]|jgi:hypothetical protein|nr:hypothetical protein [Thiocapsa sp.]MCG6896905.1 hypothetical protein [Thiocapsa sp.]MCG6985528.1 hypothetical protein [Thiocapsa sp.]
MGRQHGEDADMVSVLETRFPHLIERIEACWGDPDRFEGIFSELLLDKRGGRSGWPLDAWVELNLLQEVHDAAYGLSKRRPDPAGGLFGQNWSFAG